MATAVAVDTPYRVLGVYKPKLWKAWKVGKDLTTLTKNRGLVPHVDPKHGPNHVIKAWFSEALHAEVHKKTADVMAAEGWHYDGDTTPGAKPDCCLVLWASNTPTEILFGGKVYQPKPYEVIIFKNMSVTHRRPENCPKDRWIFRQRVAVPKNMSLP